MLQRDDASIPKGEENRANKKETTTLPIFLATTIRHISYGNYLMIKQLSYAPANKYFAQQKALNHSLLFSDSEMNNTTLAVIAVLAALALLGVVMVLVANNLAIQEAEAGCERGKAVNKSLEKSNGRCFDRGTF
jgi:hypothetical protein